MTSNLEFTHNKIGNTGISLSNLGFGTAAIGGLFEPVATKVGRILKPCAMPNPELLGWPGALPFTPVFNYSYDGIMRFFEDSQQRLGMDHIDILYVRDIGEITHGDDNDEYFKMLDDDGYLALSNLRKSGLAKAIGVGVNEIDIPLAAAAPTPIKNPCHGK